MAWIITNRQHPDERTFVSLWILHRGKTWNDMLAPYEEHQTVMALIARYDSEPCDSAEGIVDGNWRIFDSDSMFWLAGEDGCRTEDEIAAYVREHWAFAPDDVVDDVAGRGSMILQEYYEEDET